MNFKTLSKWLAPTLILSAAIVGCAPNAAPDNQVREGERTAEGVVEENQTTRAEKNPNKAQVSELRTPQKEVRAPKIRGQKNTKPERMNMNQVADYMADTVNRVPGVERSAVLLTGRTALIGVDLGKDIGGSKIDTIKYSVKEAAENTGSGYRAVVTADVDTVTRVRELIAGMRAGKPVDSIADEIADIVSRLIPEM